MTLKHDFFNTIAIIIILDTLYKNFETIMTNMLKTGDKSIEKI